MTRTLLLMLAASVIALAQDATPDIQLLYAQLSQPSTTNTAARQIHDLAQNDAAVRNFMAQHLPATISANAKGDWHSVNLMWLNAIRLAGQLKVETAIPALIETLIARNMIPVWAYDRTVVPGGTFSRDARLETDIVARALADIGDAAIPAVAQVLASGETRTLRVRAAWILINIDSPAARQVMRERLKSETDPGLWKLLETASSEPHEPLPLSVLAKLQSLDWVQRADAYANLKADQQRPDIRAGLLVLLDRENRVIRQTLAESNGTIGVSDKYGEGYSEYYAQLLGSVAQTVDWYDPTEICIVAEGVYNPDSEFAATLAVRGGATVAPCLLEKAHRTDYEAAEAVPVLVQIAAISKDLPVDVQQRIRETVAAALRNPDLRLVAINALDKFGAPDVIPSLQDIARTDPYSRVLFDGTRRYDIREAATKAIQSIQGRTTTK